MLITSSSHLLTSVHETQLIFLLSYFTFIFVPTNQLRCNALDSVSCYRFVPNNKLRNRQFCPPVFLARFAIMLPVYSACLFFFCTPFLCIWLVLAGWLHRWGRDGNRALNTCFKLSCWLVLLFFFIFSE